MRLTGVGKTTLASELVTLIRAKWLNADQVRKEQMIRIFLVKA